MNPLTAGGNNDMMQDTYPSLVTNSAGGAVDLVC